TTRAYDDPGDLLSERYTGGRLGGLSITNGYDQYLRRTNLVLLSSPSAPLSSTTYRYDNASRALSVSDTTNSAGYGYLASSPLVSHILFTNNGSQRMTRTNQYDNLNRLTNLVWTAGSTTVAS